MLGRYEWREVVSAEQLGDEDRSALMDHLAECLRAAGSTVVRSGGDALSFQSGKFSFWWGGELVREAELEVMNAPEGALMVCRLNLCNFPLKATLLCLFLLPMVLLVVLTHGLLMLLICACFLLINWLIMATVLPSCGRTYVRRFLVKAIADWRATA